MATVGGISAASTYRTTLISSSMFTHVVAINSSGQVAGYNNDEFHLFWIFPFVYADGAFTPLPNIVGPTAAEPAAINNLGQVAGAVHTLANGGLEAFLETGGGPTYLGSLAGDSGSEATAINDGGQIVGSSLHSWNQPEAFLYSNGAMTGLGYLPGGTMSAAAGINNQGQIVGWSTNASGNTEAFLYSNGVMTGLGTLPGYLHSQATAINQSGQIVGYATDSAGNTQAFLYSDGIMTGLGFLPGSNSSQATAINTQGQVVGASNDAFLYSAGQMVDLNSLAVAPSGETLAQADGINDSGQIIANSVGQGASTFLLTPVQQGRFVPVTPCRVADTRTAPGPLGGPALGAASTRSFPIPQSACNIPATAQAYSLNATVVPQGPLSYLTLWPTGMDQPLVSTLNSFQGSVVANAAIVPAGQNGAVSVYVTDPTDLILDIDGYFDATSGDSFYTVPPCRLADTRLPAGSSSDTLHGPSLSDHETRDFPVLSTSCGLPATASAYSTNVTVIPAGLLSFLTTWATGQPQPLVSTLNALNGGIVANAAIVPAGTNGAVSVYVTNRTDVVLDTNGYFAPTGNTGALTFYPVVPCRVADTREADGPVLKGGTLRSFTIPASDCSIPVTAAAYSLNVTAVPEGPLGFLTAWPTGLPLPFVSTLNSPTGTVTANAAIVPAGANGAISVYVTGQTHVILDINGYFAP